MIEVKNDDYYAQIDKRTKEYKEWKEYQDTKSKGLGDDIEKIAQATGLDKVANKVAKALGMEDCGCDKRKERLNNSNTIKVMFGYKDFNCLEEEEFVWLTNFFNESRTRVTFAERDKMYGIHDRVFNTRLKPTKCPSCFRETSGRLKKLIKEHKA